MHTSAANGSQDERRPFVVAHRAGNDLARLRAAGALGLQLAEADVHLHRGRLEVRHLKTAGPLPVLWDRWRLASARAPRLQLESLLEAAGGGPELMLDLKGHDPRLAGRVAAAVERSGIASRVTVCSQDWGLLERLSGTPGMRLVHSIGNVRALARLRTQFSAERLAGVSIHRRLLDAATVQDLRSRASLVLSWPVETVDVAQELAGLGVDGLISQAFELVAASLDEREVALA
jgi:glycerophosphoryl diester phosphodiesterase